MTTTVTPEFTELQSLIRARALCESGVARFLRLSAGLSRHEVARVVGCSASTVFRWEQGENAPHGERGRRYGELLEELARR